MKQSSFTPRQLRCMRAVAEDRYENMKGARSYRRLDFALYILMVLVVALGIRAFLFEPVRVDGSSMIPTLTDAEHMFVEKVSYWFAPPKRGDIVICFYPGYKESCVKRVIGLPGDTVAVTNGEVFVNGAPLTEDAYWSDTIYGDTEPVRVGAKEVFVMGDNRNGSKDSRNPAVGCIPYRKIEGHVRAVVWPLSHYRPVKGVFYAS